VGLRFCRAFVFHPCFDAPAGNRRLLDENSMPVVGRGYANVAGAVCAGSAMSRERAGASGRT
jgi:hypothetical protein